MINSKELRIGNFLYDDAGTMLVTLEGFEINGEMLKSVSLWAPVFNLRWHAQSIKDLKPVEITPYYLEIFGFRKDMGGGGGILEFENGFICFYDMKNPVIGFAEKRIAGAPMLHLKYVHQLQNLFFALAGRELPFKLSS